jgi:UDP-glucose 4-epimerase
MKEFADGEAALPSTALRFFNVYGPRQDPANPYSGVISLFMEKGGQSKDVTILGDGEQTRDFVFVKDVAKAIATALFQDEVGYLNPKP